MPENNITQLVINNFTFPLALQTHGAEDLVSAMIMRDKIWEAYETQLVIEHLNPGDCFVDVGANIGYYSVIASKLLGESGKVFAFEPEQKNFHLLESNIALNHLKNVKSFQAGLGNKTEKIDFYLNQKNRGDHRAFDSENNRLKSSVKILVGDELLTNQKIDFIKIDTQGYELAILQGLRNSIRNNRKHLKMIVEFWPFALKENGHSADALLDELATYDFEISIIDHIHHTLVKSDIESLRDFTNTSLTAENQGFINLFLQGC